MEAKPGTKSLVALCRAIDENYVGTYRMLCNDETFKTINRALEKAKTVLDQKLAAEEQLATIQGQLASLGEERQRIIDAIRQSETRLEGSMEIRPEQREEVENLEAMVQQLLAKQTTIAQRKNEVTEILAQLNQELTATERLARDVLTEGRT